MTRLIKITTLAVSAMLLGLGFAAPASAQASRTWVSGVGDDANPCSRTAPCQTFAGAISKTDAAGEIDCLDSGGFGTVTITKSITIDCGEGSGGAAGGILNAGTTGITINGNAIKVILRNLTISGAGTTPGTYGIHFISGKSLTMDDVSLLNQGLGSVAALSFEPNTPSSVLEATDLKIVNSIGNGIEIIPAGGLPAGVVLDHVKVTDTNQALHVEDGGAVTVTNSNLSYNFRGVFAGSNGGPVNVSLSHVTVAGNQNFGIIATSPNTIVRLNDVDLNFNGNGMKSVNNAVIYSFANNRLGADAGNSGTNGTPTPRTQQ
jgi:hypothetical protein